MTKCPAECAGGVKRHIPSLFPPRNGQVVKNMPPRIGLNIPPGFFSDRTFAVYMLKFHDQAICQVLDLTAGSATCIEATPHFWESTLFQRKPFQHMDHTVDVSENNKVTVSVFSDKYFFENCPGGSQKPETYDFTAADGVFFKPGYPIHARWSIVSPDRRHCLYFFRQDRTKNCLMFELAAPKKGYGGERCKYIDADHALWLNSGHMCTFKSKAGHLSGCVFTISNGIQNIRQKKTFTMKGEVYIKSVRGTDCSVCLTHNQKSGFFVEFIPNGPGKYRSSTPCVAVAVPIPPAANDVDLLNISPLAMVLTPSSHLVTFMLGTCVVIAAKHRWTAATKCCVIDFAEGAFCEALQMTPAHSQIEPFIVDLAPVPLPNVLHLATKQSYMTTMKMELLFEERLEPLLARHLYTLALTARDRCAQSGTWTGYQVHLKRPPQHHALIQAAQKYPSACAALSHLEFLLQFIAKLVFENPPCSPHPCQPNAVFKTSPFRPHPDTMSNPQLAVSIATSGSTQVEPKCIVFTGSTPNETDVPQPAFVSS